MLLDARPNDNQQKARQRKPGEMCENWIIYWWLHGRISQPQWCAPASRKLIIFRTILTSECGWVHSSHVSHRVHAHLESTAHTPTHCTYLNTLYNPPKSHYGKLIAYVLTGCDWVYTMKPYTQTNLWALLGGLEKQLNFANNQQIYLCVCDSAAAAVVFGVHIASSSVSRTKLNTRARSATNATCPLHTTQTHTQPSTASQNLRYCTCWL